MLRGVFEVKRCCLENVGANFFPGLSLCEDGMAQGTRAEATFLPVADFEDQLRADGISAPPFVELSGCCPRMGPLEGT